MTYENVLYTRASAKRIPGNFTGKVKNKTTHVAGDGSGGEEEIPNASKLE